MKRKISSIGRVVMALVLALSLSLVMAVPVAAQATFYSLDSVAGGTAVWSNAQEHGGTYSALLTKAGTDSAGSTYVEFVPNTGVTLADLGAADGTPEWSWWHFTSAVTSNHSQMELRFTQPGGDSDIVLDVTAMPLQNYLGTAGWLEQPLVQATTGLLYYGNNAAGTAYSWAVADGGDGALKTVAGIITAIEANAGADADAVLEALVLTRVRIELWETAARSSYIDDVTIAGTNYDLDRIVVTSPVGLETTEAGGTDTFTIRLNTQPTASVLVALSSSDTTEGTVSPTSVTFTTANWATPRTVTVTGVDDILNDGDIAYTIDGLSSSADPLYAGSTFDVDVTNLDNDPSIIATPDVGLETTEAGGTDTFTVVLSMEPTATVLIALVSSDESEGTVSPIFLIFTTTDWDDPQTVTVTGVDDAVEDGDVDYTIDGTSSSTDALYVGLTFSVGVTNEDVGDIAGITVDPIVGLVTTEGGGTDTFTIVLDTEPTDDVTIALTSSDLTEGTVSPASVTFTSADWDVEQEVTVTGVDDVLVDGNIAYTIITAAAVSADANYSGVNADNVSVTNLDNEVGITVTVVDAVTTEAGGTGSFTIVLNTEPTADVTIALVSSDETEGTVPASVTFTTTNWDTPQTVTVTGVDDGVVDGTVAYTINGTSTSTDTDYDGLEFSVGVTNIDDGEVAESTALLAAIQDIEDKLDNTIYGLSAIKTAIDALDFSGLEAKIDDIEAKLDSGGTFYTFVDDWFTTIEGYVDTEVAAILAAVDTEVASILTEVTNIEAKLDNTTYGLAAIKAELVNTDHGLAAIKTAIDDIGVGGGGVAKASAINVNIARNSETAGVIIPVGTEAFWGQLTVQSTYAGYNIEVNDGDGWVAVVPYGALAQSVTLSGFGLRIFNDTYSATITVDYVFVYHSAP